MKRTTGQTTNASGIWKRVEWPLQAAGAVVAVALFAGAGLVLWQATRPQPGTAATLIGHPVAHDGDDLRFGASVRVRLWGIAAPEDRRGPRGTIWRRGMRCRGIVGREAMSDAPELKPCPFCGGAMEDRGYGAMHLDGQGCPIGDLAIDAARWNRRADPRDLEPKRGGGGGGE